MGAGCLPAVRRMVSPPPPLPIRVTTRNNQAMRTLLLALAGLTLLAAAPPSAKTDSKRDLQGIWEAHTTAEAGLEAHGADAGIRAGDSVIVDPPDGKIPYKPDALAKRAENFKNRAAA